MTSDDNDTALPRVLMHAATPVPGRGGAGTRPPVQQHPEPAPPAAPMIDGPRRRMTPAERRAAKALAARERRARERGERGSDPEAVADAVKQVAAALKPLGPDARRRAMEMVRVLLGDE